MYPIRFIGLPLRTFTTYVVLMEEMEKKMYLFVSLMNILAIVYLYPFGRIFVFVFNPLPNDHTSRALLFYDKYYIVFRETEFLCYI